MKARHLIHVGYPKAGSTYLQRWFAAHPRIAFHPGGIAGFQTTFHLASAAAEERLPEWHVTSCEDLLMPHPRSVPLDVDYARLDRDTVAQRQAAACRILADLFPAAHILIVARGFRSMILSSYSEYIRTGGSADLEALASQSTAQHPWHYDRAIAAYREAFGGRVTVLPYELLAEDPRRFRAEIERAMDLPPFAYPEVRPNPSLSGAEMRWYPRIARAVASLPGGRRTYAVYVRAAFANRLRRPIALLDRLFPAPPVSEGLVGDALLAEFRGAAASLADEPLFRRYAAEYLF